MLCLFERGDGRFSRNRGKTLQKLFEGFSPFQIVEQCPDRHSRSAKHRGSAKYVPIFADDFHFKIIPTAPTIVTVTYLFQLVVLQESFLMIWRRRVEVESTIRPAKGRIAGFEGREGHRNPIRLRKYSKLK